MKIILSDLIFSDISLKGSTLKFLNLIDKIYLIHTKNESKFISNTTIFGALAGCQCSSLILFQSAIISEITALPQILKKM